MIGRLHGILLEKQAPALLVDVHGVGYEVEAPLSTHYRLPALGQVATLFTHLIIREDAHQLFGFISREERALFRELIKITGVGPKMALALLSGMEPEALLACLERGDVTTLTRIPGVGKKTAERLIMEMRDRIKGFVEARHNEGRPMVFESREPDAVEEAQSALVALGYKPAEAQKAVAAVKSEHQRAEDIIRAALRRMVK